jgi:hypothetical protein
MALNQIPGCATGGRFALDPSAGLDEDAARDVLRGDELIFDVHLHHVDLIRPWRDHHGLVSIKTFLKMQPQGRRCPDRDALACFSQEHFIKAVFLDSDTDLGVLSIVPERREAQPLTTREAVETRELVNQRLGTRLMAHGLVIPNMGPQQEVFDEMQRMVEEHGIAAWKAYTQWGPQGRGFWLDDPEIGLPFLEHSRRLGVKTICVHKGLLLPGFEKNFGSCRDIGAVAKRFPDLDFLVYHSGFERGIREGPYREGRGRRGIDALIDSLREHGVGPNANVYADLGSTWHFAMRNPNEAAHVLGKLLRWVGEDRVLWGTDAIWYGSPQDQIEAFRAFQILPRFQERFGYPALTPQLKRKVFGLNAAGPYGVDVEATRATLRSDEVAALRREYADAPDPRFESLGPRDAVEYAVFEAHGGHLPRVEGR